MTISELHIQLDLNRGNEIAILEKHTSKTEFGYFFVDSENGTCYFFDKNGKLDDINKIKTINEHFIKKDIKKIVVLNSVESIGKWAFYNCESLASIEIPDNVKSIGKWAFEYCKSLKSIKIPYGVKSIGEGAFSNCTSLTSIEIPKSVKSIGDWAFAYCDSLKSIEILDSVESIGDSAFWNCTSLTSLVFKGKSMDKVKAIDGYPWGIKDESVIKCC